MNHLPDVEPVLRAYLADTGDRAPDRVLADVAARIAHQPRRARRLPWRLPMNPVLKYGIAVAAVLLIAVVGYNLLPRSASFGGPAASPTPIQTPAVGPTDAAVATTKPTATPFPCGDDVPGCGGLLTAGTHASTNFKPAFTMTTPDGWTNSMDTSGNYELDSPGAPYLLLWSDVDISQHNEACTPEAQPGVGNTVQDWLQFLSSHPGITAGKPVTVDLGDAHGKAVDLDIKPGWTKTCPNLASFGKTVQFIMHADGSGGTYGVASWIKLRLNILDVAGETILVEEYGTDPQLRAIVSSMKFTAAP